MDDITKLSQLFKDDEGQNLILAPGQQEIFNIVVTRKPNRNHAICPTQYGKSLSVSLGIVVRATSLREKWGIVGATEKKAKIIMNYVIQHLFDNPLFYTQLTSDTSLERLKAEKSKQRLTFRRGGEIFVLSAQARNEKAVIDALSGFGSPNVVLDDSSLISNNLYAMVKRMLGGHKDNFLFETGNPFFRNHFYKTSKAIRYNKLFIDYKQALKEGRYTQDFIDEMRDEPYFDILYECKFPDEETVDEQGWSVLVSTDIIYGSFVNTYEPDKKYRKRLGVDIARGGNYNAFVVRQGNYGYLKHKDKNRDTMATVGSILRIMSEEGVAMEDVFVDVVGVGAGVVDRLLEQNININAINEGAKADLKDKFSNKRAEIYWLIKEWLEKGGKLKRNDDFLQLCDIKFKVDSSGRIRMISKDDMRKRGYDSPDVSDALSLTFGKPDIFSIVGDKQYAITGAGQVGSAELFKY